MLTVWIELAQAYPAVWNERFENRGEAAQALKTLKREAQRIGAALELALASQERREAFERKPDPWFKITVADLSCLTGNRPALVVQRYREGLAAAGKLAVSSVRRQIEMYHGLGVLAPTTAAVLPLLDELQAPPAGVAAAPVHVIVFTGHRMDAPGRAEPRFPPAAEAKARAMIRGAVEAEAAAAGRAVIGIAGAASGGDILFHEVCAELGVETQLFLVVSREDYVRESVADGGAAWVDRFNALFAARPYRFLGNSDTALELPKWLRPWKEYDIWNRSNLWMLHNALAYGPEVTLIALWNGKGGDGPGGTRDMVESAKAHAVKTLGLDAGELLRP
jgi:hypothetical protein